MGGYEQLKAAISAIIRTNNNQEITGATLQSTLLSIINTIASGSTFKGVATLSTNPGSPDANVFYIAGRPGYYPNFNLELTAGLHVIENKTGSWVNTEIQLDVVDAINIGGAKHVKPSQAMLIALQTVEQIPDSQGLNNKMWWSTDGKLKYKQSDIVYDLGSPAYVLYYCGDKIYKWTGSGFREIGGGGSFASGEALSNITLFDDGADTEGKTSSQLASMIPSGAVIRSILDLISSIDTSGGGYDGSDLITTFSYDAPTRVITIKQANREAKTIILPLATSINAGLMSAQDKVEHADMYNLIGKTVHSFSQLTNNEGISITLVTTNGTSKTVTIPIDDAPGNTDNPVKSRGIKQAIDNATPHIGANGNWWTGAESDPNNDTGIKAQGPKGDSVIGGSVNIINNVNDGGETDALSAEMGKILRINLMKIYNALGVYAFPDGKPTLNWGSTVIKHRITASLSNLVISSVLVDGVSNQYLPAQITDGQSLSFVLNTQSDLYIIDSDNLAITMGGIDIKLAAYNADTGAISIPAVNGDILISAVGYTYLQQNLAFQLDCFHGVMLDGNIPTKWTDLVGNVEFNLTDVTVDQDGSLVFNGSTSKGVSNDSLNVSFNNATVEVVAKVTTDVNADKVANPILANNIAGGSCAISRFVQGSSRAFKVCCNASNGSGISTPYNMSFSFYNLDVAFSASRENVVVDGTIVSDPRYDNTGTPRLDVNDYVGRISTVLAVGYIAADYSPNEQFFAGKIMAIRVYNTKLTSAQMQANYNIDKKRFNLQ